MRVRTGVLAGLIVVAIGLGGVLDAGASDQAAGVDTAWTQRVRRVTLDNGLTVLLLQRGTLPIVSVEALYKVGSRNERPGLTGAAHYIEHMAFRRTERINKGDLTNQVLRWGGRWGGYTSYDQTVYDSHAPSAYLDWLLFMERQRLSHVLFDGESVDLERTSVISELRQYENDPLYTLSEHRLRRAALVAHPYGSPIMGWISDLQAITASQLERFYRDYYAANNLVLAIVGRFDEAAALALVHKHFDDAGGDGRSTRLVTVEPEQTGARRVVHRGPGSASHVQLLVHAPSASDPRYPALLVLDGVLAGGKAEGRADARPGSRLDQALIESGLAHGLSTEVELSEYPGLYAVTASSAADADLAAVEAAIDRTLAAASESVSDEDVKVAARQVLAAFALRDDSNRAMADRLARFEGIGSYHLLPRIVEAVDQVTAADVRSLAAELFATSRHNVGWFVPEADTPPTGPAASDAAEAPAPATIAQRHAGTVAPPPATLDVPSVPPIFLGRLPNGLTVGVAPLGGAIVHVRVRVAAGALDDPPGREGLAVVTARASTDRGLERRRATLDPLGLRIDGSAMALDDPFANRMFVEWTAALRPDDLGPVLGAMAGIIVAEGFDSATVQRVQRTLGDEVTALQDDSLWRATEAAWQATYPTNHPLGRAVHGTTDSVAAIVPDDVSAFHRLGYRPSRTIVAISGAVTEAGARAAVTAAFGRWQDPAPGDASRPPAADTTDRWPALSAAGGREIHIELPHKLQSSIAVALPAAGAGAPDQTALSLLNYLLGETGYAGVLGEQLVDTGIAYAVYATLWPYPGTGPLLVTTEAVQAREATARIRSALETFATTGVTDAQLREAKGFALGRLLFRFETPAAASATVADLASRGDGPGGLQAFAERVAALTRDQLNTAAAKYYDPRRAVFVVAGR